jgi:hypothetical protein
MKFPPNAFLVILAALALSGAGCGKTADNPETLATAAHAVGGDGVVENTPALDVPDQTAANGSVMLASVTAPEPSWVVIRRASWGKPGDAIGYGYVAMGTQKNISIEIDAAKATRKLFAELHMDAGTRGTYEFPGADAPVVQNGSPVIAAFAAELPAADK